MLKITVGQEIKMIMVGDGVLDVPLKISYHFYGGRIICAPTIVDRYITFTNGRIQFAPTDETGS